MSAWHFYTLFHSLLLCGGLRCSLLINSSEWVLPYYIITLLA